MKRFRKLLSLLLTLIIVAGVVSAAPLTAYADGLPYNTSGKCGVTDDSDVEWFAFDDKSMVIFGTGEMRNYTLQSNGVSSAPWYGFDVSVIGDTVMATKIAVEYGVTSIGDYSFYVGDRYVYQNFIQLKNIDIANTVTSIGKYAFYNQKVQEIIIPGSVKYIGENAFKNCQSLRKISYFGDPDQLVWDTDGATDTEFYGKNMVCHILKDYASQVDDFNTKFAYKNITFVADMDNPYKDSGEELSRNIALYYGAANSGVFGGAAPYIIVGSFDGKKKSVTHGSNGFASAVKIGNEYYILTDVTTGALNLATINSSNGRVSGYSPTPHPDLKLHITHQYIGSNTVKVIYRLENTGNSSISNLMVGGTGDIKIGADDFASIEPLHENENNNNQVGFYMKSNQSFDKSTSGNDYATLGFIGEKVEKTKADDEHVAEYYEDASFFYGEVDANASGSAAGTKTVTFMPERIFSMNTTGISGKGISQSSGKFEGTKDGVNRDSGMSYYWNVGTLDAKATKEYAVLFSVYGASDDSSAQNVVNEQTEVFHTVTWQNDDGSVLLKTVVKDGETPVYTGPTPYKASTEAEEYSFNGTWSPIPGAITEDTTYTAQYDTIDRNFFIKHSLSLDGDIGVNYYVDVTRVGVSGEDIRNGTKKVKLKFHWYDKNSEYIIDSDHAETRTFDNKECFKAKCSVNAAEMAYDIHATAYYSNDGGTTWTEYTDEQDIYSVREYAKVILDRNSDFSQDYLRNDSAEYNKLYDLMVRMLDYGAKAQLAFDRKTDDLANSIFPTYGVIYSMEDLTAEQIGARTSARDSLKDENISNVGLKSAGSSVVYLSNTSIRHYFTVEDDTKFTQEVINANHGGFTYHTKDHGLYFELSGIPASKLDESYGFTIGEKKYNFSVLNYSQMVLNSTLPQADKDLAIATVWYNDAANTYFGD